MSRQSLPDTKAHSNRLPGRGGGRRVGRERSALYHTPACSAPDTMSITQLAGFMRRGIGFTDGRLSK
jgi:hypothetical protein